MGEPAAFAILIGSTPRFGVGPGVGLLTGGGLPPPPPPGGPGFPWTGGPLEPVPQPAKSVAAAINAAAANAMRPCIRFVHSKQKLCGLHCTVARLRGDII